MCTAKEWRRVCGVTDTPMPNRSQRAFARANTDCQVAGATGSPSADSHNPSGPATSPSGVTSSSRRRAAGSSRPYDTAPPARLTPVRPARDATSACPPSA